MWDHANAVLVGVNQRAGLDLDAADHDRLAEIDQSHVGVAHAGIQAEELETERAHFVEIARAAARDMTDASELLVDRRCDFTKLRAEPGGLVEIPADSNLR